MKGMLVVGFIALGVFGFSLMIVALRHQVTRLAGVRKRDNRELRDQLTEANVVIAGVQRKIDEIGELNPILANALRPIVGNYLVEYGRNVR